jgi:serine/threonine protein phosphatase PrpC
MHEDSPGLAMSRSLGDYQAHSIGVIPDPGKLFINHCSIDIEKYELNQDDKFIIIASDGVWEFLENEEVAEIVWPFFVKHSPEAAGNALVRAAAQKWKENDTVIDDITCIIIFMEID